MQRVSQSAWHEVHDTALMPPRRSAPWQAWQAARPPSLAAAPWAAGVASTRNVPAATQVALANGATSPTTAPAAS